MVRPPGTKTRQSLEVSASLLPNLEKVVQTALVAKLRMGPSIKGFSEVCSWYCVVYVRVYP